MLCVVDMMWINTVLQGSYMWGLYQSTEFKHMKTAHFGEFWGSEVPQRNRFNGRHTIMEILLTCLGFLEASEQSVDFDSGKLILSCGTFVTESQRITL